MDNTIIPYQDNSESSSEDLDDSSSDDEHSQLLSNNIGVLHNKFITKDVNFMNMENAEDYESLRNKYFNPDIRKIRLMIESKNVSYISDRDTSNYKISFEDDTTNSTAGYGNFDNVIGFRLIRAHIFNSLYTVNDNNRKIIVKLSTGPDVSVNLTQGSYTFQELGDHLISILNGSPSLSGFSITKDTTTFKYTINNSTSFRIKWSSSSGSAYRLFGFFNNDNDSDATSYISDNVVQQSNQFVDLVIPEVPYIACKRNSIGKNLIDRIPLDCEQGSIMYYSTDINLNNYFTPINLNSLTIQLYEDTTDTLYDCQNNDNSFEFELTILNRRLER